MEESIAPNQFVVPHLQAYAYAGTDITTSKIAEYLMTELEPVNLETLDPDERCPICTEEFDVSNHLEHPHAPVKTSCGHIYGRSCIIMWLDPLRYFDSYDKAHRGNTSCPACRTDFFPSASIETMETLAARLWFWDKAYSIAGVARSEEEEHTRKYLWQYVKYRRSANQCYIPGKREYKILKDAQLDLLHFAKRLKTETLTHVQEDSRRILQRLGKNKLREIKDNMKEGFSLLACVFASESESAYISNAVSAMITCGEVKREDGGEGDDEVDTDDEEETDDGYSDSEDGNSDSDDVYSDSDDVHFDSDDEVYVFLVEHMNEEDPDDEEGTEDEAFSTRGRLDDIDPDREARRHRRHRSAPISVAAGPLYSEGRTPQGHSGSL